MTTNLLTWNLDLIWFAVMKRPTHSVEFEFQLREKVKVKPLNVEGIVIAMTFDMEWKSYRVAYWWDGKRTVEWLMAEELESIKTSNE